MYQEPFLMIFLSSKLIATKAYTYEAVYISFGTKPKLIQ